MREETIRIAEQISGVLTYPEQSSTTPSPAVLLLHGFATDKNEVNNTNQQIAAALAQRGIISLRIDFRGYGDSAGKPEDFSVMDMIDDAQNAYQFLSAVTGVDQNKMGIIGFSLGAAVALLISERVKCHALGLLSPALNLLNDFTAFLGKDTIDQLSQLACAGDFIEITLPWRSIKISKAFYESLRDLNPQHAADHFGGNLFCIAGSNDFSAPNATDIHTASPSHNKAKEIISEADHIFNTPDGNVIPSVIQKVCDWMIVAMENTPTATCKM